MNQTNFICPICLEDIVIDTININISNIDGQTIKQIELCNCINKIHTECLEKWLKINSSCPLCRKVFHQTNNLINNNNDFNNNQNIEYESNYPFLDDQQELIQIYEERRERLLKVRYLLKLACLILITSAIFSGFNVFQKIKILINN